MESYKHELIKKLGDKEENLTKVQKQREHKMLYKHNDDVIKMTDKKENV